MKATINGICLLMALAFVACGGGGGGGDASAPQTTLALTEGETQSGFIATKGEVDTYRLSAAEANRFLYLHCAEETSGSEVDLLVTVYEEVNGERVRLFGKHKPDGATLSADLDLWIYVDTPKELYVTVRDFMDDDSSDTIPYLLTYTYQDSAEGNHDFSTAQSLAIGHENRISDAIEDIGEVDCFTFAPQNDGVYSVDVRHHSPIGGSPVQLAISLYDHNGNKIQRLAEPYHTIVAYLEQGGGPYFVIVEDNDSMDGDAGAPYDIVVETVAVDEADQNDRVEDATLITNDGEEGYTAAGAIDYGCSSISPGHAADADWYRIVIGEEGGSPTYHQIELTIDNGDRIDGTAPLRVTVTNADLETVTAHDFTCGGATYQNQFRVHNGEYFVSVIPASSQRLDCSSAYRVRLQEVLLNDAAEEADDNTINSAIFLTDEVPVEGYVSYHADVDWYAMNVNTASASVLSVDLTANASVVDDQLSIWRGDRMIKRLTDIDGSDGPTHLKTAILVPAESPATMATYHIRVCDAQNNEGSSIAYTLTADVEPVAGAPGQIAQTVGQALYYYDEVNQEAFETTEIELEIFSTLQPQYKANTDWLDFRTNPDVTLTAQGEATVIHFPWICGYIDYQGDRDLFQLDFDKLDPSGAETSWYYDVEIRLVVPSPGSEVEYVWKLYRDSNNNAIVMDDPTSPDGYKACAGDTTPRVQAPIDLTTPIGSETFWIGSEWGSGATFYIGMSDFNFLLLPEDESPNPETDDDWGYDAPYYFNLTLTYHPGQATPD